MGILRKSRQNNVPSPYFFHYIYIYYCAHNSTKLGLRPARSLIDWVAASDMFFQKLAYVCEFKTQRCGGLCPKSVVQYHGRAAKGRSDPSDLGVVVGIGRTNGVRPGKRRRAAHFFT